MLSRGRKLDFSLQGMGGSVKCFLVMRWIEYVCMEDGLSLAGDGGFTARCLSSWKVCCKRKNTVPTHSNDTLSNSN
jgi:hypothetical protein